MIKSNVLDYFNKKNFIYFFKGLKQLNFFILAKLIIIRIYFLLLVIQPVLILFDPVLEHKPIILLIKY